MKIYLDNIKSIDWLNKLLSESQNGAKFLATKLPAYFLVFYNYIEEKSEIDIKGTSKSFQINDLVYREQYYNKAEYTGVLQEPFDSNNLLFYLLLRNLNPQISEEDKKKIDELFLYYKSQDLLSAKKAQEQIKIKGAFEINGKSSYYDAISQILFINPDCINGIQLVTDMIDSSVSRKYGYSFYNRVLKKIVISLSSPDGGLITEEDGLMRYMFVGERYFKNDTLEKAKSLLRSGIGLDDIFLETGWYWNKYDKKWRYKLRTMSSFKYKADALMLIDYKGNSYNVHIPENFKDRTEYLMDKLIEMSDKDKNTEAMLDLVANGYSAKLSDLFDYEDLFSIYPELKNRLVFFLQATNPIKNGIKNYAFYNSESGIKHLCLISDRFNKEKVLTIAAHEIQHAIQKLEGFGNGGNEGFANMIISVGGGEFRRFFFLLTSFIEEFIKKASLIPLEKWKKLADEIENSGDTGIIKVIIGGKEKEQNLGTEELKNLSQLIRYKSDDANLINAYSQQIAYAFLLAANLYPNASDIIQKFIKDEISYDCGELFDISNTRIKASIEKQYSLTQKGWSNIDIRNLNFRTYQYLLGEYESRYIQATTKLDEDLISYFTPYTSETINPDEINVYGNDNQSYTDKSHKFGIELTPDNRYILHTRKNKDAPQMILHEYGHILFDLMKDENITEIEYGHDKESGLNVEEYFCESFVDYVLRKNIDRQLTESITEIHEIKNYDKYDLLFDYFFIGEAKEIDEKKLSEMLLFINQIIEIQ
jgi:hypothetical protein